MRIDADLVTPINRWNPLRIWDHWSNMRSWIMHFAFALPWFKRDSECAWVKAHPGEMTTFWNQRELVFHCAVCAIPILFLRFFVRPFIPKKQDHFGLYRGFWNDWLDEEIEEAEREDEQRGTL